MVVGASTRLETLGGSVFHNLLKARFQGQLYPVNPGAGEVQGVEAFPRIADVPGEVDLAVVVVPRDAVPPTVEECGRKGAGAAAVITAGFSETGPEGKAREEVLGQVARKHKVRIVGPNCIGTIDTHTPVNTTFVVGMPQVGDIGFNHPGHYSSDGIFGFGYHQVARHSISQDSFGKRRRFISQIGMENISFAEDTCRLIIFRYKQRTDIAAGHQADGIVNGSIARDCKHRSGFIL